MRVRVPLTPPIFNLQVMFIPQHVKELIKIIKRSGHQCYLVGGCVRDFILNRPIKDYDLTTDLTISKLKEILKSYKFINKNGEKHNTLTIHFDNDDVEITSFKHELDENNDLIIDALHRDFTINAIYYDDTLIDPNSGIADLNNKIIRAIYPKKVFNEDSLRILRALRFASILDFEIEEETKKEIFENISLLKFVSVERIRNEFELILKGKNIKKIMNDYKDVFFYLIPELKPLYGFKQYNPHHFEDVFNHSLSVVLNAEDDLKIPALLHDIGKPQCFYKDEKGIGHFYGHPYESAKISSTILKRFKYSNDDIKRYLYLIRNHQITITCQKKNIKKNLSKANNINDFISLVKLQNADRKSFIDGQLLDEEKIIQMVYDISKECFNVKSLDIDGNDLIKLGYRGKEIGIILNTLLDIVIEEKVENKKERLVEYLKYNF